jgi:hypothetical protein
MKKVAKKIEIIEKLQKMDAEKVKEAFIDLMEVYLNPAFGSISKADLNIFLFIKLQELDLFSKRPEIYELVSKLRVTRAKASNLIYESTLRERDSESLDEELIDFLLKPIFLKDNDKIIIEIDNQYLIDHLKYRLKKIGHITDSSFSPELVKLTINAFTALFESYLPEESKKDIEKALIKAGAKKDNGLNAILFDLIKELGIKLVGQTGANLAESAYSYLKPLIKGNVELIEAQYSKFFKR